MRTRNAALEVIRNAARGRRVRAELPADRDAVACREQCLDPSKCDGQECFVAGLVKQTARARVVMGVPGQQVVNAAAVYIMRIAARRSAS